MIITEKRTLVLALDDEKDDLSSLIDQLDTAVEMYKRYVDAEGDRNMWAMPRLLEQLLHYLDPKRGET